MTSQALAPLQHSPPVPAAGGQGSVAVRPGRRRLFTCEMRVEAANNTDAPMMCSFSTNHRGEQTPFGPKDVWIDPYTTATIPLRLPPNARTLDVRLRGISADYHAHAEVARPRVFALLPILIVLAAIAAVVSIWMRPSVQSLSVPESAFAGDTVRATYAFSDAEGGSYVVRNGGAIVEQGRLFHRSGSFSFQTATQPATYDVSVYANGAMGNADDRRVLRTQALPQATIPAAIGTLAVTPAVATSGKPFVARYRTNADNGVVKLLDDSGVLWDAQPYHAAGTTAFLAPHVDRERHFVLRLDVRRGTQLASASTGVVVMPATPSPSPSPSSSASPAPSPPPEATVITVPQHLVSGASFLVKEQSLQSGILTGAVTLQSASGSDIASVPANGPNPIAFRAPRVTQATRYFIVATVTRDKSSQLVVTPIDVYP